MATGDENSNAVLQSLTRHVNCLTEENRNVRKNALINIRKEIFDKTRPLSPEELDTVFINILKPVLKTFSDPVEKCRELSIDIVTSCIKNIHNLDSKLSFIFPVFVQRLGQQEITEPSEELRAQLTSLLLFLVEKSGKNIGVYVDDCVLVLQRTLADPFPEVKKESCKCASLLAVSSPSYFYSHADLLVKPLLLSIAHQHSKVRQAIVETIGTVLQYSNGKAVDDVVSHLAQRLFDKTPSVRKATTRVVGGWLLDLPDRYSYHHKLIPLILTSLSDEQADISELADELWSDIGLKYERENEDDLKDKLDFEAPQPVHYPQHLERPNLGCRVLVNRHLSKILPGLIRDLGDWVVETRIKCASLLYWLLVNAEDYTTQHVEPLLTGIYKACYDEEPQVVQDIQKSAELVGFFVQIETWKKLVLTGLRQALSFNVVMTIAAIVRGSPKESLLPHQKELVDAVLNSDVSHTVDDKMHLQIINFCHSLLNVVGEDISPVSQQIFNLLVGVIAMAQVPNTASKATQTLEHLAETQGFTSKTQLFEIHTKPLIDSFGDGVNMWTNFSPERQIFDTLLIEAGPVVGKHLEDIVPIIVANLQPEKDPELRLKFFSLLSRLVLAAPTTLDSQNNFCAFAVIVAKDMILPNCVWKAGRTASAIRATAISCMWALLQSGALTKEMMEPIVESVLTQLVSLIEDDTNTTRLVACRVLTRTFDLLGSSLDQDRLHNLYPELLKRLDDSSNEIRLAMTCTLLAYFDCFVDGYDAGLYRAHLEAIYKGLLLHLDDTESSIQKAVLGVMKKASELAPHMLIREVENVKHKHRSTKYCDELIKYAQDYAASEKNS